MSLTVEDGTVVANADSYVSEADFITYAASFNVTIASGAATEALLRTAAMFVDSHESRMKGDRYSRDQYMAFPRVGVTIEGFDWSYNEIPRQVIMAQMAVALDINAGVDPYNPAPDLPVIRNRVEGVVEQEFATPSAFKLSKTSKAQALISSFLRNNGLELIRA